MFKIPNIFKTNLTWYLLGCIIIAGLISFSCGYLVIQLGFDFVENVYDDQGMNKTFQVEYMEDLQSYVAKNQITAESISELEKWTDKNTYVYLSVYQNNRVIFNSDYTYYDENSENNEEDIVVEDDQLETEYLYGLALADGSVARVDIFCYDYWKFNYYVWIVGVIFGVILFISIFTKLFRRKVQYINQMERELQILEGGNLEYPITIKGEDEISNLARGIEQMRLSIIENIQKEKQMLQANKDLVTAMSHDLRTPLTTLTGYLEILNMNHIKDEEQRQHYLQLSLAKTREIKELSDELFEYFLIYGEDRKRIDVEPVPAYTLVMDLIENQFLGLEEDGFELSSVNRIEENAGNCMINVQYMQRVLNNILSNLEKYADKEKPIEVSAVKEQNFLVIRVRNGIRKNLEPHESTKIGLITCERIMRLHHGEFQKYEVEDEFTVKLLIPMENG
ncbi:MAG: histidine kinase dimerization/phospho-acceptor domain-containing protein [Lachnospiraceae bacterium]